MSYEIKPDYSKVYLLPPAVEDWLPADHPARFIRDLVESLDLKAMGFEGRKTLEGRPSYSDELLLKMWLFGFFNDIRSSRKLERAGREMIGLIWLMGVEAPPDHNTLWRFLKRSGAALKKVLVQTARLGLEAGLVQMEVHAVDGTKLQGRGAKGKVVRRRLLEKELARLEQLTTEYLQRVEQTQDEEEGQYQLPKDLQDAEDRKAWLRERLAELNQDGASARQMSDPEAREMKIGDGPKRFGYNAQTVVDTASGLIVASSVTNEQNDMQQLLPMVEVAEQNLGAKPDVTLADAGYATLEQLGRAEEEGRDVLVHLPKKLFGGPSADRFHNANFRYDTSRDVVVCPIGVDLPYCGEKKDIRRRYTSRVYRCPIAKDCPHRGECCPKTPRRIAISPHNAALERQREKLRDPKTRSMLYRLRRAAETPFAISKQLRGFRRFTSWGLAGAEREWTLMCLAMNLAKLYNASRWNACLPA